MFAPYGGEVSAGRGSTGNGTGIGDWVLNFLDTPVILIDLSHPLPQLKSRSTWKPMFPSKVLFA